MAEGLQSIINSCNGIAIDRRKVVGIQYTRNEIPRVSLTPTTNPWRITLEIASKFRYYEARALMEELDTLDRFNPQVVTFGDNPNLSWIFKYQGTMTTSQINTIRVQSFVGDQLVLENLPVVPASRVLFAPNDLIQIGNYFYPYTSTTTVTRGTGSTVTVTTHRPNIITTALTPGATGIVVGNKCNFYLFCPNMPTYKMIPRGTAVVAGEVVSNALIQWSSPFQLYEFTGTA